MIATHNQPAPTDNPLVNSIADIHPLTSTESSSALNTLKNIGTHAQLLVQSRIITHTRKAGLNPLVDEAAYLLSVLGKLKRLKSYRHPNNLRKELIQEINRFQDAIKKHGYNAEYTAVSRYIICAAFDDVIANTGWGCQISWENNSLLAAINQDTQHQHKFYSILERAIKEPQIYIDMMELMYICLSLGYKGQYRTTEHDHYKLEQITNTLYKHIRLYRGNFNKSLSPSILKPAKPDAKIQRRQDVSLLHIFFFTGCAIMTIFISLGYLMDVISNEAFKNISQIQYSVPHETAQ